MMKRFALLALVVCSLAFQEAPPQDSAAAQAAKAVDGVVYQEVTALRVDARLMVRAALAGPLDKLSADERFARSLACIEPDLMRTHLFYLGSDDLAGRCAGKASERTATDYIAEQMRRAGLTPVGENGTYLQKFTTGGVSSRNCLGLLEGSDPQLKNEIVVVGGHHDHLGRASDNHRGRKGGPKGDDDIWNGADDNGSGTTTVLTIARAFGAMGVRPKRSVLFMTFGAEEFGLWGSEYYVEHPLLPMERTVAMINLDMVGRNPDDPTGVHGVATAEIFEKVVDAAAGATGLKVKKYPTPTLPEGDSDSSSFYKGGKGIPVLFFFTGDHDDYHRVSDHPDLVAYDHLALVGKTAATVLWDLANRADAPKIKKPSTGKKMLGVRFGVPQDKDLDALGLGKDEGGVMVTEVVAGGAAEKAGLLKGDVILKFGDKTLPRKGPDTALPEAIQSAPAKTTVEVYREGKRLKIDVAFGD